MNAGGIDWAITAIFMIVLSLGGLACQFFIKNVDDWTCAGRKMRKCLGLSTHTAEGIGLTTIVAMSEVGFRSGFVYIGASMLGLLIVPIVFGCTGFVVNRYREAEVVTIPEYAQRRYSKGVRITTGAILGLAGVLNLAIFPIMASQFLTYMLDAPETVSLAGLSVPLVPLVMAVLIALALLFAYTGGMVAVLLTDYIQAVVISFAMFTITVLVIMDVGLVGIHETVGAHFGEGGVNPLKGDFLAGKVFLTMSIVGPIVGFPSFAPTMQRLASTDSPKTARQWTFLAFLFAQGRGLMIMVWGVGALAVLGAAAPEGMEQGIYTKVAGAMYLGRLVPPILFGVVLAGMLSAFISTVDSYMLTSATLIANDVICPMVPGGVSERQNVWLLKILVALVAVFLYLFGIVYQPAESVLEYFILTGAMMWGSGIILIGGLYWKRGSTAGAYAAVISCCVVPFLDLLLKRIMDHYPLRPQDSSLGALLLAVLLYVVFSIMMPDRKPMRKQEADKHEC